MFALKSQLNSKQTVVQESLDFLTDLTLHWSLGSFFLLFMFISIITIIQLCNTSSS